MHVFLPIAQVSVNGWVLLALGGGVGFLSGLFGAGGAFLLTPLLIFIGVPPPVAVASVANELVAASLSGVMAHWRHGSVDFRMGGVLLVGGLIGSSFGVWLFGVLRGLGQVNLAISLCYVVFLGAIGFLMLFESWRAIRRRMRHATFYRRRIRQPEWVRNLPIKMRFPKSRLYLSPLLPLGIGLFIGIITAIMGAGSGSILVPAMIYLIGMPVAIIAGTSLFQVIFVSANVTFLQAITHQTVDVVLALLLLVGAVVGAQFGTRFGSRIAAEHLRGLHGLMVLAVCGKMFLDLFVRPAEMFSVSLTGIG